MKNPESGEQKSAEKGWKPGDLAPEDRRTVQTLLFDPTNTKARSAFFKMVKFAGIRRRAGAPH